MPYQPHIFYFTKSFTNIIPEYQETQSKLGICKFKVDFPDSSVIWTILNLILGIELPSTLNHITLCTKPEKYLQHSV